MVEHPVKGVVPLVMQQGCPTVDEEMGKKLLAGVEGAEESKLALRKVLLGQQEPNTLKEEAVRRRATALSGSTHLSFGEDPGKE